MKIKYDDLLKTITDRYNRYTAMWYLVKNIISAIVWVGLCIGVLALIAGNIPFGILGAGLFAGVSIFENFVFGSYAHKAAKAQREKLFIIDNLKNKYGGDEIEIKIVLENSSEPGLLI